MHVKPNAGHEPGAREMRAVFCEVLMQMAEEDPRVCLLDADLMNAAGTKPFREAFPDRTFDCGVQEANMIGVAAGLSATGMIPFAHTFSTFASRRACDQIFLSCLYARQNVKIVGSDPGILAGLNGGTHMPFEDVGILRSMPGITVVEPADATALRKLLRLAKDAPGTWYIRLARRLTPEIYEDGAEFEVGGSNVLREGGDVSILAMGYCAAEGLKAAELLAEKGISARVVDVYCVKPIDRRAVVCAARETGAIVTAENHNVINGLGSAVADVLCEEDCFCPLEKTGARDEFGEVGPVPYLAQRFHMTAEDICAAAERAVARKRPYRP